ncbi:MAG TPA: 30S ribosomal protein S16 [Thermomicrobiales bacterium]|jgi:small subunit ribosomal protein S16|nr:30S ribosomal protein S16 [Thermomicrobiales bacterium]
MIKIRLKRMGAKKRPSYRLIVADSRSPRDGRFIETIGFYDPIAEPAIIRVDGDRARHWFSVGAQPTDTARSLLVKQGILTQSGKLKPAVESTEATTA